VALLGASAALSSRSWLYAAAFAAQAVFYLLAAYGALLDRRAQPAPVTREVFREAA
jgi:hypothetical protein